MKILRDQNVRDAVYIVSDVPSARRHVRQHPWYEVSGVHGPHDVLDRLAWHRVWGESDDVAGMARLEGGANLALGFKATDAGTVSRSRIDDNKGALALVDLNVCGRDDGASI
jgi:hypothetical protein